MELLETFITIVNTLKDSNVLVVANWSRSQTRGRYVMSSSLVSLKTRSAEGGRCTLNILRLKRVCFLYWDTYEIRVEEHKHTIQTQEYKHLLQDDDLSTEQKGCAAFHSRRDSITGDSRWCGGDVKRREVPAQVPYASLDRD
ncbi:hypothetical protein TNCV_1373521 [Trichonephila clavipes]|uniref:Uncharacterized protein n=1 Tax=Trichonephila clavipes TaxID=2585209 RepID=A0A8X6WIW8_TRICX|nr:hypothetical protein TNCV_1373521 [Trichonephila clavipes]